jgi:hypothetical protein
MGWCSATEIFDNVVSGLVGDSKLSKEKIIENLVCALEDGDWDCQSDSAYVDHPLVRKVFEKRYPGMYEEDGE